MTFGMGGRCLFRIRIALLSAYFLMTRCLLMLAMLLPIAASGVAQEAIPQVTILAKKDSEWHSYRRAYSSVASTARTTRSRPLIQTHMQIRPNRRDLPMDGLRIQLEGETTNIEIAVDPLGRAVLPMSKQAYDEDAVLRLNRLKGAYHFSGRFSIRERDDGNYRIAELRAACEQLISVQRESGYRLRLFGKRCAGVKFVYRRTAPDPVIGFEDGVHSRIALGAVDAEPFENDTMGLFRVVKFRFADWPQQGSVVAGTAPIAIGTIYE